MNLQRRVCGIVVPALVASGAFAQPATEPLWEFGVGAAVLDIPDYRGSSVRSAYLLPFPYFTYRGPWLKVDREGARAEIFTSDRVDLTVSLHGNYALKAGDNPLRQGMPELRPTVELGPELIFDLTGNHRAPVQVDLRLAARSSFSIRPGGPRYEGWVARPYLQVQVFEGLGPGVEASFAAGPLFGDRRYHRYFYGVGADQRTPTRPAYEASGGYAGMQFFAGASRRFGDFWLGGFVRYDALRRAAFADSPLVDSRNYVVAGVAFAWIVGKSSEQVPRR